MDSLIQLADKMIDKLYSLYKTAKKNDDMDAALFFKGDMQLLEKFLDSI